MTRRAPAALATEPSGRYCCSHTVVLLERIPRLDPRRACDSYQRFAVIVLLMSLRAHNFTCACLMRLLRGPAWACSAWPPSPTRCVGRQVWVGFGSNSSDGLIKTKPSWQTGGAVTARASSVGSSIVRLVITPRHRPPPGVVAGALAVCAQGVSLHSFVSSKSEPRNVLPGGRTIEDVAWVYTRLACRFQNPSPNILPIATTAPRAGSRLSGKCHQPSQRRKAAPDADNAARKGGVSAV